MNPSVIHESFTIETENTAFVDGKDGCAARREGSQGLLEALAKELEAHA